MSKMSRNKGARGEREVAELIELASNGAFKAQRGCQHAGRFAVGVAELPFGVAVEVDATFEIA